MSIEVAGLSRKEVLVAVVEKKSGQESYVGRVLKIVRREERVMSDVYADVSYAQVVELNGAFKEIYLTAHFECGGYAWSATADAAPAWHAYADAYSALAKACLSYQMAVTKVAEVARTTPSRMYPVKGSYVMVDRASKGAPKGASGEVFYVGTCRFSGKPRIGFLHNGTKCWSASASVSVVPTVAELEAHEAKFAADKAAALSDAQEDLMDARNAALAAHSRYEAAQAALSPMAVAA